MQQVIVRRVVDGDTVHVSLLSDPETIYKIRMQGMDAPESKQEHGPEATAALNSLLFPGKLVWLDSAMQRDKYRRVLGTIYVSDTLKGPKRDVHLEMIRQGHAWVYRKFGFPNEYDVAERQAREARRGLWAEGTDVEPPWEWRKRTKRHGWQRKQKRWRKYQQMHYPHRRTQLISGGGGGGGSSRPVLEPTEEEQPSTLDDPKADHYYDDVVHPRLWSDAFRQVVHTTPQLQLVRMTLQSNELLPAEVHPTTAQIFVCMSGEGSVMLREDKQRLVLALKPGKLVVVNAGTRHAVLAGESGLRMYTLYSPPEHPRGTLQMSNPEVPVQPVGTALIEAKCTEEQCQLSRRVRDKEPLGKLLGGRILVGSLKHARNCDTLKEYGITHIMSTIGPPECKIRGYIYHWIKLHDDERQHLVRQVVLATRWMRGELDKYPDAKILVHCKAGVSRSASLAISYMILEHGLAYDQGLEELRKTRDIVNPNPSFEEQLRSMQDVQRLTLEVHAKLLKPVQKAYEPYTEVVTPW